MPKGPSLSRPTQKTDEKQLVPLSNCVLAKDIRAVTCLGWSSGIFLVMFSAVFILEPELLRFCRIALVVLASCTPGAKPLAVYRAHYGSPMWDFLDMLSSGR